jgi:hypothetical protein
VVAHAEQQSSHVNQGFHILRCPLARAKYLVRKILCVVCPCSRCLHMCWLHLQRGHVPVCRSCAQHLLPTNHPIMQLDAYLSAAQRQHQESL